MYGTDEVLGMGFPKGAEAGTIIGIAGDAHPVRT
jgi:hypothetical protein